MSNTPPPSRLLLISQMLAERQFSVAYIPADADTGELLLVTATVLNGAVVPMRLVALNDLVTPQPDGMAPLASWLLHASLVFPFYVAPEHAAEVMRATQLVNRVLPLCSLGVIEPEGGCYLQACVAVENGDAVPRSVLFDVIGMARMAAETYAPALADIAAGRLSSQDFARAMAAVGTLPPPLFNMPEAPKAA